MARKPPPVRVPDVAVIRRVEQASRECRRAVVAALGYERADVGVHPPALGQQDAAPGRDRLLAISRCSRTEAPEPPG